MHTKEVEQLTYIDLQGKYKITSLHGQQYYILFIDDASHYTTIEFLKAKSQASNYIKIYLTHLKNHGRQPLIICIDYGKEFINENLKFQCHQQGIDINQTAPYLSSQNGVAKWINHTLIKLVQTMHAITVRLWCHINSKSSLVFSHQSGQYR